MGVIASTGSRSICVSNIAASLPNVQTFCLLFAYFSAKQPEKRRENRREIKKSTEYSVLFCIGGVFQLDFSFAACRFCMIWTAREMVNCENSGETEGENTTSEGKYCAAMVAAAALFRILEFTATVSSTG